MTKFLLDSANLDDVKRFAKNTAVAGVTTNPSLVSKEKKRDYLSLLCEIADVLNSSVYTHPQKTTEKKHLSVEVTTLDPVEMIRQAELFSTMLLARRMYIDVHIKIPVMSQTLEVLSVLRNEKYVKTNATACMTALQAKMAADAGANVVSFFYNRMIDGNTPKGSASAQEREKARETALLEIQSYSWRHGNPVPYICGSVRTVDDVEELCADQSPDKTNFVTVSAKILDEMIVHPKTTEAIEAFDKDIKTWLE